MTKKDKESHWRQIGPGMFSRPISDDERVVSKEFVEEIAETIESSALRALILETAKQARQLKQNG